MVLDGPEVRGAGQRYCFDDDELKRERMTKKTGHNLAEAVAACRGGGGCVTTPRPGGGPPHPFRKFCGFFQNGFSRISRHRQYYLCLLLCQTEPVGFASPKTTGPRPVTKPSKSSANSSVCIWSWGRRSENLALHTSKASSTLRTLGLIQTKSSVRLVTGPTTR